MRSQPQSESIDRRAVLHTSQSLVIDCANTIAKTSRTRMEDNVSLTVPIRYSSDSGLGKTMGKVHDLTNNFGSVDSVTVSTSMDNEASGTSNQLSITNQDSETCLRPRRGSLIHNTSIRERKANLQSVLRPERQRSKSLILKKEASTRTQMTSDMTCNTAASTNTESITPNEMPSKTRRMKSFFAALSGSKERELSMSSLGNESESMEIDKPFGDEHILQLESINRRELLCKSQSLVIARANKMDKSFKTRKEDKDSLAVPKRRSSDSGLNETLGKMQTTCSSSIPESMDSGTSGKSEPFIFTHDSEICIRPRRGSLMHSVSIRERKANLQSVLRPEKQRSISDLTFGSVISINSNIDDERLGVTSNSLNSEETVKYAWSRRGSLMHSTSVRERRANLECVMKPELHSMNLANTDPESLHVEVVGTMSETSDDNKKLSKPIPCRRGSLMHSTSVRERKANLQSVMNPESIHHATNFASTEFQVANVEAISSRSSNAVDGSKETAKPRRARRDSMMHSTSVRERKASLKNVMEPTLQCSKSVPSAGSDSINIGDSADAKVSTEQIKMKRPRRGSLAYCGSVKDLKASLAAHMSTESTSKSNKNGTPGRLSNFLNRSTPKQLDDGAERKNGSASIKALAPGKRMRHKSTIRLKTALLEEKMQQNILLDREHSFHASFSGHHETYSRWNAYTSKLPNSGGYELPKLDFSSKQHDSCPNLYFSEFDEEVETSENGSVQDFMSTQAETEVGKVQVDNEPSERQSPQIYMRWPSQRNLKSCDDAVAEFQKTETGTRLDSLDTLMSRERRQSRGPSGIEELRSSFRSSITEDMRTSFRHRIFIQEQMVELSSSLESLEKCFTQIQLLGN